METHTVWSFPDRGSWATHDGSYPGNWSPYVPRNLVLRYSAPGDMVLDPMMGSGTTLVECKLLGRKATGVDVNREAVMVARDRLAFEASSADLEAPIRTYLGDARFLDAIPEGGVDLIAVHPPYANIIRYGGRHADGDLSDLEAFGGYLGAMRLVAAECFRVLKRGKQCAVLIGDTRRHLHYVPLSSAVLLEFLKAGFVLLEDVIKIQHNTTSERTRWQGHRQNFLKIAHEHLLIFRKPAQDWEVRDLQPSSLAFLAPPA